MIDYHGYHVRDWNLRSKCQLDYHCPGSFCLFLILLTDPRSGLTGFEARPGIIRLRDGACMRCRQTWNATCSTTVTARDISSRSRVDALLCSLSPVFTFFLLSYAALQLKAQALVATANVLSTSGCGDSKLGMRMTLGDSSRGVTTGLTVIRESANQGDPDPVHHPFLSNRGATSEENGAND